MQTYDEYIRKLNKIFKVYESHKNKDDITKLLNILLQSTIFGDFGLNKSKLLILLDKENTKISEFIGILRQHNLCVEIQNGKNHYFKCNLEELDNID